MVSSKGATPGILSPVGAPGDGPDRAGGPETDFPGTGSAGTEAAGVEASGTTTLATETPVVAALYTELPEANATGVDATKIELTGLTLTATELPDTVWTPTTSGEDAITTGIVAVDSEGTEATDAELSETV